jgi:hypothetical protein
MLRIFTILSEFPQYREEEVLAFSGRKLEVVYREALRQRASKFSLLGTYINLPKMKDKDRDEFYKHSNKLLNPYFIRKEVKEQEVNSGWDALRKRGR